MIFKWLPWKYMVRRAARAQGFLDPILVMSRLAQFAQPSEVGEPIELLRAGLVFHARGLMNTRAIQNNLDWIWPYWVERQFNPHDISFIPRAFSISHVNLSHRNWTAVGLPDCPSLPIIDPSGLVTPFYDGWSVDAWIVPMAGAPLIPSKSKDISQSWQLDPDGVAVETSLGGPLPIGVESGVSGLGLQSRVDVIKEGKAGTCRIRIRGHADGAAWLVISLRPYNPEGVSFINDIKLDPAKTHWNVDGFPAVAFSEPVERHFSSEYHVGDVYHKVLREASPDDMGVHCKVGLATGAALFAMEPGKTREITLKVDLAGDKESRRQFPGPHAPTAWAPALQGLAQLQVPDERFMFLYQAAVRSLLLHSPGEVFPGPYTYKRFWFRDAAFIINAMLAAGMVERSERALDLFPKRQTMGGYFLSQEGEWDSNGEALWILKRFCEVTGSAPKEAWLHPIEKAADWIMKKRIRSHKEARVVGLFPAGFSAEHLGPNDYYYWDDFWGAAGLQAAASLLEGTKLGKTARSSSDQASDFLSAIDLSLREAQRLQSLGGALPASPFRRMDPGAIGSLAVTYPLALWSGDDPRVLATLEFLLSKCMFKGGFFQDMIHSGINAYLTLHMAQALLRAGDPRYFDLIRDTAALASSTGQWPEAIHPHTMGGCMGDGHHVWASAEWVLMMRNLFIREEGRILIIGSGLTDEWLRSGKPLSFGPAPTSFGTLTVSVKPSEQGVIVSWEGKWHAQPSCVMVRLPGRHMVSLTDVQDGSVEIPHAAPSPQYQDARN
jgi:hypothetical protein